MELGINLSNLLKNSSVLNTHAAAYWICVSYLIGYFLDIMNTCKTPCCCVCERNGMLMKGASQPWAARFGSAPHAGLWEPRLSVPRGSSSRVRRRGASLRRTVPSGSSQRRWLDGGSSSPITSRWLWKTWHRGFVLFLRFLFFIQEVFKTCKKWSETVFRVTPWLIWLFWVYMMRFTWGQQPWSRYIIF